MQLEEGVQQAALQLRVAAREFAVADLERLKTDKRVSSLAIKMRRLIVATALAGEEFINSQLLDLERIGSELGLAPLHSKTLELQRESPCGRYKIAQWTTKSRKYANQENDLRLELGQMVRSQYPALSIYWTGPQPARLHKSDCTTIEKQSRVLGGIAALVILGKVKPIGGLPDGRFCIEPSGYEHLENDVALRNEYQGRREDLAGANAVGVWRRLDFHSVHALQFDLQEIVGGAEPEALETHGLSA